MLTKEQKTKIVEDLSDKLRRKKIAVLSDFRGISVSKIQGLRKLLKNEGVDYKVAKKTLLNLALKSADIELDSKTLEGEMGISFGYGEETVPAKILMKFSKENETFKILGGIMGSRVITDKEVMALAKLPPREALLAQVVSAFQSPISGLARALQGNIKNLVVVLNKIEKHHTN